MGNYYNLIVIRETFVHLLQIWLFKKNLNRGDLEIDRVLTSTPLFKGVQQHFKLHLYFIFFFISHLLELFKKSAVCQSTVKLNY